MTRLWAIAVLTVVGVIACDRVPLTAPTLSTISVTVDQTTLPLNGRATVRAVVIESAGTPVQNGTQVVFSTTLGNFTPPEVETMNGVATTIFLAGTISGTTRINAYSGGISTGSGNSSSGGVSVQIGAAAAGSVSLQVVPPTVGQNGGSVSVTALVLDPNGNALPGVPVLFSADVGTLSNANVISDVNGYANTNLITTREATVTARVGQATPATFKVTVSVAPTVTIAPVAGSTPTVGIPVAFTVTLPPSANASPVQSVFVDFGDGQTQTFGAITGSIGLTHTYNTPGGYTVSARATDINGGVGVSSTSIVVVRQQLPTVTITAPATATTTTPAVINTTAATTAPGAQIVNVRVTLQDGTVIYNGSSAGSFNYRFAGAGTYTLTVTATDSNGNTATAQTQTLVS